MPLGVLHAARQQRDFHVFQDREPGKQREALEHDGHVGAGLVQRLAVPENLAGGGRGEAGEHAQQRGLARAGRSQQGDDGAWFNGEVGGRDDLNLAAVGALEALLDVPGLDDRRHRRGGGGNAAGLLARSGGRGAGENRVLPRQFVHQALPGFLGQIVEELQALVRVHLVDDGIHFIERPRVQQNVGVVVGGDPASVAANGWETAEEGALIFEGEVDEGVGGDSGVEALQQLDDLVPTALGEDQPELLAMGVHGGAGQLTIVRRAGLVQRH